MFVEMKVDSVTIDTRVNTPVVLLKGDGGISLPIWIGLLEASSIATVLEGVELTRPMTHDLFINMAAALGSQIAKIEIKDLKDNVYYASVYIDGHIKKGSSYIEVDARPSDAIALALRVDKSIFVEESVILKSKSLTSPLITDERIATEELKQELKDFPAEVFNKYKI